MDKLDKLASVLLDICIEHVEALEDKLLKIDLKELLESHEHVGTHEFEYSFPDEYECSVCEIQVFVSEFGVYEYWSDEYDDNINVKGEDYKGFLGSSLVYPCIPKCRDVLMDKVMK